MSCPYSKVHRVPPKEITHKCFRSKLSVSNNPGKKRAGQASDVPHGEADIPEMQSDVEKWGKNEGEGSGLHDGGKGVRLLLFVLLNKNKPAKPNFQVSTV